MPPNNFYGQIRRTIFNELLSRILCFKMASNSYDHKKSSEQTPGEINATKSLSESRNESRQNVVIVCTLIFGLVYVFHLIRESVIFLTEVLDEGHVGLTELDVQHFTFYWLSFMFFLIAGLSVLVYIWRQSYSP